MDFYRCKHCGNIIAYVENKGVPVTCCGEKMSVITPNTVDASGEKHIPVCSVENGLATVNVGSIAHPMEQKHYIQWIVLVTNFARHRKILSFDSKPTAVFALEQGEEIVQCYAYCNLHGLWLSE